MKTALRIQGLFFIVVIQLLLLGSNLHAQQTDNNSLTVLLPLIHNTIPDTNRIALLNKAGIWYLARRQLNKNYPDSAIDLFNQALQLSCALNNQWYERKSLLLLGKSYLKKFWFEMGRSYYLQVITGYRDENNFCGEAETWDQMGRDIPDKKQDLIKEKIFCYENARKFFMQCGNTLLQVNAMKEIADAHLNAGLLDQSENELLAILEKYKTISYKQLQYTYDLLAVVNRLKGNLDKALYYNLETIHYMEINKDSADAALYYHRIAQTFADLGMNDKSILFFRKALAVEDRNNDDFFLLLEEISKILIAQNKPAEALAFLEASVKKNPPVTLVQITDAEISFGNCYTALRQYAKAEHCYLRTVQFSDSLYAQAGSYLEQHANDYIVVSDFFITTNQFKKADIYLKTLLHLPPGILNAVPRSRVQLMCFKTDSATGHYTDAISHLEVYKQLTDSIFNAKSSKQIEELQIKYESEQKNNDLKLTSKNMQLLINRNNLQQAQVKQSRLIRNVVIAGATLIIVLLAVGFSRYKIKQQKNLELEIKQREITSKNISLEKILDENQWLLREVHHRVQNNLKMITDLLGSQSSYLKDTPALNAVLGSQQRIQAMFLIHQKLYNSSNASAVYMPAYVYDLVDFLKNSFKIKDNINFNLEIEPIDLGVLQAVPVALILNEAITNAIKHAFPFSNHDSIHIHLSRHEDTKQVVLVIADNGKGLPDHFDAEESKSFGIVLINGLAEDLEGNCTITSGTGTTVALKFISSVPAFKEVFTQT
jgi:two-component system, sensor histidine kinase PdtaS